MPLLFHFTLINFSFHFFSSYSLNFLSSLFCSTFSSQLNSYFIFCIHFSNIIFSYYVLLLDFFSLLLGSTFSTYPLPLCLTLISLFTFSLFFLLHPVFSFYFVLVFSFIFSNASLYFHFFQCFPLSTFSIYIFSPPFTLLHTIFSFYATTLLHCFPRSIPPHSIPISFDSCLLKTFRFAM